MAVPKERFQKPEAAKRTHWKAKENLALDTCKQTGTVHQRHKAYYVDGVLYYKGKILQSNQ